jgi:hypothetical protein
MNYKKITNQIPKKQIIEKLKEHGVYELWQSAMMGNRQSIKLLQQRISSDNELKASLELLKPRRNPFKNKKRRNQCAMEAAKNYSTGWVTIYRGGAPK